MLCLFHDGEKLTHVRQSDDQMNWVQYDTCTSKNQQQKNNKKKKKKENEIEEFIELFHSDSDSEPELA